MKPTWAYVFVVAMVALGGVCFARWSADRELAVVDGESAATADRMIVALPDVAVTDARTPVTVNVVANDTLAPGVEVKFPAVELPQSAGKRSAILVGCDRSAGVWTINEDMSMTFTPVAGFHGHATCRYDLSLPRDSRYRHLIKDGPHEYGELIVAGEGNEIEVPAGEEFPESINTELVASSATIEIEVRNGLVVNGDRARTSPGIPVMISVLENDIDVDRDAQLELGQSSAGQGTWVIASDEVVIFTPNPAFHGSAAATYTVTQHDGTSHSATITVLVK
nr:Ig-like domain-containing protein [Nocardioides kongjuensis]